MCERERELQFPPPATTTTQNHHTQICHPDRSEAQWRDLLCASTQATNLSISPSDVTDFKVSHPTPLCHPDRGAPGFPTTRHLTRTRLRLSLRKPHEHHHRRQSRQEIRGERRDLQFHSPPNKVSQRPVQFFAATCEGALIRPINILVNRGRSKSICACTSCTSVSGLKGGVQVSV
jgi:hypothetical protein